MSRSIVLFVSWVMLIPSLLCAQVKAVSKKIPHRKYAFVTLPMFTEAIAMPTREGALKAAFDVFKEWEPRAAASLEVKCTITKVHDVTFKTEQFPTLLPDGSNDFKAMLTIPFKYSHVTWDAEITVKKDITISHVWFGREQLIDFHVLSYFEGHLEKVFHDRINTAIYKDNAINTYILKAGEKIRITDIHSIMAAEAKGNDWMCWVLKDDQHPENYRADVATLTLTKATTPDAKSISIDYTISQAAAKEIHFEVYRSETQTKAEGDNAVLIANSDVTDSKQLAVGTYAGQHSLNITLLPDKDLSPDTRLPYVVVVATCNGQKSTCYFRKWLLGAVSHGFDRLAMSDPLFTDVKEFFTYSLQSIVITLYTACRDYSLPDWEKNMAKQLKDVDGYDDVIAFNWMETCALPAHEHAIDAGFELADMISTYMTAKQNTHPGDVVDLHLIGHSRGTVIVSQALNVLPGKLKAAQATFNGSYVELTLLDPHPANNHLEPVNPNPSLPGGISWASWGRKIEGNENFLVMWKSKISPDCSELIKKLGDISGLSYQQIVDNAGDLLLCMKQQSPANNCLKGLAVLCLLYPETFSNWANSSTTKFQEIVHDNPIMISKGVKKIDIFYQHTPANLLYDQPDQEFIQNLWGMVSPETIKCDGCTLPKPIDLTGLGEDIPGVGIIGHNQVPLYYEQIVEAGNLNRSPETSNTNVKP